MHGADEHNVACVLGTISKNCEQEKNVSRTFCNANWQSELAGGAPCWPIFLQINSFLPLNCRAAIDLPCDRGNHSFLLKADCPMVSNASTGL